MAIRLSQAQSIISGTKTKLKTRGGHCSEVSLEMHSKTDPRTYTKGHEQELVLLGVISWIVSFVSELGFGETEA